MAGIESKDMSLGHQQKSMDLRWHLDVWEFKNANWKGDNEVIGIRE
jgi:hypothetical protein